jgi:hypothetical protein
VSYTSEIFAPDGVPENVKVGAWVLCAGCSRGVHDKPHTSIDRCQCDLCKETA